MGLFALARWAFAQRKRSGGTGAPPPSPVSAETPKETSAQPATGPIMQLTVEQIVSDIESRPPLQRQAAAEHYVGYSIRFSGVVRFLFKRGEGIVSVTLRPCDKHLPKVSFGVSIQQYPEFNVMPEGTPLTVEGKVEKYTIAELYLRDAVVKPG